mmetsp:Transcript_5082/g.16102  ORF Transcript_5082/g.16102 Transcript_5082/m.16102 type:complete len:249 (-) Transcript_5082:149-895(-)
MPTTPTTGAQREAAVSCPAAGPTARLLLRAVVRLCHRPRLAATGRLARGRWRGRPRHRRPRGPMRLPPVLRIPSPGQRSPHRRGPRSAAATPLPRFRRPGCRGMSPSRPRGQGRWWSRFPRWTEGRRRFPHVGSRRCRRAQSLQRPPPPRRPPPVQAWGALLPPGRLQSPSPDLRLLRGRAQHPQSQPDQLGGFPGVQLARVPQRVRYPRPPALPRRARPEGERLLVRRSRVQRQRSRQRAAGSHRSH